MANYFTGWATCGWQIILLDGLLVADYFTGSATCGRRSNTSITEWATYDRKSNNISLDEQPMAENRKFTECAAHVSYIWYK